MSKRQASTLEDFISSTAGAGGNSALVKRQRQAADEGVNTQQVAITSSNDGKNKGLVKSIKRTSSLSAPIISLAGAHSAELLDVKFSPDGAYIAAASADRTVSLWTSFGDNTNLGLLAGHSKAVTAVTWSRTAPSHTPRLITASADSTLIVWEALSGAKLRRLRGHRGVVNCVAVTRSTSAAGGEMIVSGADDGRVCVWMWEEQSKPRETIDVGYPVTAVEFSEDGSQVFVGGLDNDVHIYDLTRKSILFTLRGHTDTILSLALSPSGTHLLSSSLDGTLRIWDIRPFAPEPAPGQTGNVRLYRTLTGLTAGFEQTLVRAAWSADGERVGAGGGDRTCTVWNVEKSEILYKLPGHRGTCTAMDFHPKEPVVVSCSYDMTMLLGEIEL